ncbi:PhoD-like phosphatase metallophosphatase domain-containing protein [Plasmodiophora brassicae]
MRTWRPVAEGIIVALVAVVTYLLAPFLTEHFSAAMDVDGIVHLGAVTSTSARLLVHSSIYSGYQWAYADYTSPHVRLDAEHLNCSIIVLEHLSPNTSYDVDVHFTDGPGVLSRSVTFRTFEADPEAVTFAFGSCTLAWPYSRTGLPGVRQIAASAIDFALFLGDQVYVDVPFRQDLLKVYRRTIMDPGYAALGARVPLFTAFDDHEIENDWSNGPDCPAFKRCIPFYRAFFGSRNPPPVVPGELFYTFDIGAVSFFVLDTRQHASDKKAADDETKMKLGAVQKGALLDWLRQSQATFKFVASSMPWSDLALKPVDDGWVVYRTKFAEIASFVQSNNITGVVLISGDAHWAAHFQLHPFSFLHEFSASAIGAFPIPPVPWRHWSGSQQEERFLSWTGLHYGRVEVQAPHGDPSKASVRYTIMRTRWTRPEPVYQFDLNWTDTIPQKSISTDIPA